MVRPTPPPVLLLLLLLLASVFVSEPTSAVGISTETHWDLTRLASWEGGLNHAASRACEDGRAGECVGEEENGMESVISRRSLVTARKFISYGALIRDGIPCDRRGRSYYNCHAHDPVNPYRRGCSMITRCARILH